MRLYFSFILFTFSIISFSEPRLGKDFFLLNDPLPVKQDGIVEVTEVFWYGCGHCYAMESKFKSWNKTQPDYVNFQKDSPNSAQKLPRRFQKVKKKLEMFMKSVLLIKLSQMAYFDG